LTHAQYTAIVIGMQMRLELPPIRTWGGERKGAGRKPTRPGHRIEHTARPWHDGREPVHVTFRVVRGLRLRRFQVAREIGKSFRALVGGALEERFRVVVFCVLEDHVHLIVEARDRAALTQGMRSVTIRLARAVNRVLGRRGRVVVDRYHARALRTPTEVRNGLNYVLQNGRKHGAPESEFVDGLDSRSSAHWFPGWADYPPRPGPPVSTARTHLLRQGWKFRGPLRRTERPAA
jgi:REP element-mobilizing transposase RayT